MIESYISAGISAGVTAGVSEGIRLELINTVLAILETPMIKSKDIAKKIEKSIQTVERYIKRLKKINIIEYKGSKKIGGYIITNKFEERIKRVKEKK